MRLILEPSRLKLYINACDGALEATAIQRALGYSYETEKAFQTGVRMTVTETMPPNEFLLKFLLERRMPEPYRPSKEVVHTHNAGALFQEFLRRMDEQAKLSDVAHTPQLSAPAHKTIDITPEDATCVRHGEEPIEDAE